MGKRKLDVSDILLETIIEGIREVKGIDTSILDLKKIETAVNDLDGIEVAELDVTSKKLKVKYDSKKLSLQAIRERVASVGYQADDVKAIEEAYKALPGCCQLDGGHD